METTETVKVNFIYFKAEDVDQVKNTLQSKLNENGGKWKDTLNKLSYRSREEINNDKFYLKRKTLFQITRNKKRF